MPDQLIVARSLHSGYDRVPVLRELNLTVAYGEVVALLGPNGAGKTTTLRTIAGLLPPTAGSIEVLGQSIAGSTPHRLARRGLAYVPDNRCLFVNLTVDENLRLGLHGDRRTRRASRDRALDLVPPLRRLLASQAGSLSGGEQQMLALARAVASSPKVLLIDELSLGLAPIIVDRLLPIVREIADQQGVGVLMVEQHVHLALAIADRAYVMSNGRIRIEGAASDLAERPDLLEATYLGNPLGDGC